jgi:hypothetical protein
MNLADHVSDLYFPSADSKANFHPEVIFIFVALLTYDNYTRSKINLQVFIEAVISSCH